MLIFSLLRIGVRNLRHLQSLSDEIVGSLTNDDLTFSDYQKLRSGISKLQQYEDSKDGLMILEMEMLSHHKVGFVRNMYSVAGILRLGKKTVVNLLTLVHVVMINP